MRTNFKLFLAAPLLLAAAAALTGCGNVSRNVAKDGKSADMVWPKVTDTTPMHKGGTFPNRDNLIRVHAGLNKQQISDLIGFPHFSEGVWGVREWNYVLNFREPANSENVVTCEFKVLFDENKIARSFYWNPSPCARFQQPEPAPAVQAPVTTERFTFSADALFAFDRSSVADITGSGRAQLDQLASNIEAHGRNVQSIRVIGYTDRIGGDAYNNDLSQKRANTVKSYLVSRGTAPSLVQAEGRGKADPVTDCSDRSRDKLIACLAPNRRVVILINSVRTAEASN